jgi:hypothetical protein
MIRVLDVSELSTKSVVLKHAFFAVFLYQKREDIVLNEAVRAPTGQGIKQK